MLKSLGGPLPQLRFCPTGGIDAALAPTYLALPNAVCVGGSWVVPKDAVAGKDWGRIRSLAEQARGLRNKG
ncbi:KHG/KDPG aldolase [compost metagenome]